MQMEDLLAACLDAQERGCGPGEILDRNTTPDQRVELEALLSLAERIRQMAAPPLRREARDTITTHLAAAMQMQVASGPSHTWV